MSNNITIASYRTGLYFSFFSFLRKGEVCTVAHYLQCNMIQLPEGEKSQPIVQGLYMDWTLRSKFPWLKNVTPPSFPLAQLHLEALHLKPGFRRQMKIPAQVRYKWRPSLLHPKEEFFCLLESDFLLFFLKNGFVTVIKKSYKSDWSTTGLHQLRILHIFL